jgi:glutamine phosphoribosylpyrophosphate amidotransferase
MSDYNDDNLYSQWVETLVQINETKDILRNKTLAAESFKKDVVASDRDGCMGLEFTDHAIRKLLLGLEALSEESSAVAKQYFGTDSFTSLSRSSNAQNFMLLEMTKAFAAGKVVRKPSQSSSGFEYHYNCRIDSWFREDKVIEIISVVESNKIKTIFFNWVKP